MWSTSIAPSAEATAAEIGAPGLAVVADIGEEAECARIVEGVVAAFGPVEILVNCAQWRTYPRVEDLSVDDFMRMIRTGPLAAFMLSKAVLPSMKELGRGKIINFGSCTSENPAEDNMAGYVSAKGAIRAQSKALAWEWGRAYNIQVNTVWPAAMSPSFEQWQRRAPEQVQNLLDNLMPLQRFGDADRDVAPVVVFLASEDSDWVTGQTIGANGGRTFT